MVSYEGMIFIIACFCASACVPSKVPSVNDTIRDSRHTDSRHTSLSASSGDHTCINESSMNLRSNYDTLTTLSIKVNFCGGSGGNAVNFMINWRKHFSRVLEP